jgi:hypothetical protein
MLTYFVVERCGFWLYWQRTIGRSAAVGRPRAPHLVGPAGDQDEADVGGLPAGGTATVPAEGFDAGERAAA